ncbi:glycine radical domain-containing protein, partial [Vibrio cholerae]|uniref:glycine radical domain-containing protein n=1 Tax=Vibrio cholerae TaxID=666 RepID=UPI001851FBEC
PMQARKEKGAVTSLTSAGKLTFAHTKDGISYSFSIVPNALGKDENSKRGNLAGLVDRDFHHEAGIEREKHLNVSVLNR